MVVTVSSELCMGHAPEIYDLDTIGSQFCKLVSLATSENSLRIMQLQHVVLMYVGRKVAPKTANSAGQIFINYCLWLAVLCCY